jgi:hypothetical protein
VFDTGAHGLGTMEAAPRTTQRIVEHKRAINAARKELKDKGPNAKCSVCGKEGRKAEPGARVQKFHAMQCGTRKEACGPCSNCGVKGKSMRHIKKCGTYV